MTRRLYASAKNCNTRSLTDVHSQDAVMWQDYQGPSIKNMHTGRQGLGRMWPKVDKGRGRRSSQIIGDVLFGEGRRPHCSMTAGGQVVKSRSAVSKRSWVRIPVLLKVLGSDRNCVNINHCEFILCVVCVCIRCFGLY